MVTLLTLFKIAGNKESILKPNDVELLIKTTVKIKEQNYSDGKYYNIEGD